MLTVRMACLQAKGVQDAGAAAVRVSGLEVGGLFGSLLAGRISDWMVLKSQGRGGNVGKRVQVGTASKPCWCSCIWCSPHSGASPQAMVSLDAPGSL